MSTNFKQLLKNVSTFMFDVDGVFTDGSVFLFENGQPIRRMNIKDGYAVQLAAKKGYRIVIISGGRSEAVKMRLKGLGATDVFLGVADKIETYTDYITENNIDPSTILYMGDDIPDYSVMKKVGVPVCPSNAATEIKEISVYISPIAGGQGCVRDVVEQTLRVQGKWMDGDAHQW
jgi:3-deoxy-D-manno-octulosonate 8-phosphate phosphatase (KDO 8-P phosphatase)